MARRHIEHSVEIIERLLGPDHAAVANVLGALARVDLKEGRLRDARALLERALDIQHAAAEAYHPLTSHVLFSMSELLMKTGELDAAQALLVESLAVQRKAFGGSSKLSDALTRRELAKVLTAKGDLPAAIEQLQHALAVLEEVLQGGTHPILAGMADEVERLCSLQRDVQRPD